MFVSSFESADSMIKAGIEVDLSIEEDTTPRRYSSSILVDKVRVAPIPKLTVFQRVKKMVKRCGMSPPYSKKTQPH